MTIYADNKAIKLGFIQPKVVTAIKMPTLNIIYHPKLIWSPVASYWFI